MKIVFICLNLFKAFLKRVECFNISSSVMHLLSFEKELWIAKVEKCCRIFRWKLSPPECVHISFFYFTFKLTFQLSLHGTYPVGSSYQKYSLFFQHIYILLLIFYYLYSTRSNGLLFAWTSKQTIIASTVQQKLITFAEMKFLICWKTGEIKLCHIKQVSRQLKNSFWSD